MAFSNHRQVEILPGDKIIISASAIPGNEKAVSRIINELYRKNADVVYDKLEGLHVSGHACQEELKLLTSLVKPKYYIPLHGEQKHLYKHALLAQTMGVPKENTLIAGIGDVIEVSAKGIKVTDTAPSGRILVDGLGVGDVGGVVLRDRKHLADDGIIIVTVTMDSATGEIVSGPEIVSRGFVYVKESEQLINDVTEVAEDILEKCYMNRIRDWNTIKLRLRDGISKYLYSATRRSPMVLPIIMEI
jgi:ribonuclease J